MAGKRSGTFIITVALTLMLIGSASAASKGVLVDVVVPCSGISEDADRNVILNVSSSGSLTLNDEIVRLETLTKILHKISSEDAERPLFFMAEGGVEYGEVIRIMSLAKQQIRTVVLLTHSVVKEPGQSGYCAPFRLPSPQPNPFVKPVSLWWR